MFAKKSSACRLKTPSSTERYRSSLVPKWRYTISLVTPAAAATSSIEVAAYPEWANAAAAASRIAARAGRGLVGGRDADAASGAESPDRGWCGCDGVTLAFTLPEVNLQLNWSEQELLATDDVLEPNIANGVKCHGGYASDGTYVPPRTKNRIPAIENWQQAHREAFGTEILESPLDQWPAPYPNVAQTKYLLRRGCARTDDHVAHAHRDRRGLRRNDPSRAPGRHATLLRREHRRHRDQAPRPRSVRSARARRSRMGRRRPATTTCGSPRATSRSRTR